MSAHAENDWNAGVIPAHFQRLPVEQRFLVELVAINMHERHFRDADVDPASVALAKSDTGVGID